MSKAAYSKDYLPPAPIFPVKLATPGEAPGETTRLALVDTGADGTFVPTSILEELALPIVYMTNVRSYWGIDCIEFLYTWSISFFSTPSDFRI